MNYPYSDEKDLKKFIEGFSNTSKNSLLNEQSLFIKDFKKKFNDLGSDKQSRKLIIDSRNRLIHSKQLIRNKTKNIKIIELVINSYNNSMNMIENYCRDLYPELFSYSDKFLFNVGDTKYTEIENSFFKDNFPVKKYTNKETTIKINVLSKEKSECIWFKVGLLFAEGKIQKIKKDNPKISFKKIAQKFNNESYEAYIKATLNEYTKSNTDKNIYSHIDKLENIFSHCEKNNITICEEFKSKYNSLKQKQY